MTSPASFPHPPADPAGPTTGPRPAGARSLLALRPLGRVDIHTLDQVCPTWNSRAELQEGPGGRGLDSWPASASEHSWPWVMHRRVCPCSRQPAWIHHSAHLCLPGCVGSQAHEGSPESYKSSLIKGNVQTYTGNSAHDFSETCQPPSPSELALGKRWTHSKMTVKFAFKYVVCILGPTLCRSP